MAVISCKIAGSTRDREGRSGVRLANVNASRFSGLKNRLICCLKLVTDIVKMARGGQSRQSPNINIC